jgi:Fe-S oxidoreductase
LEKTAGVARQRRLPAWSRRPFWRLAPKAWLQPPTIADRPVIYLLDYTAVWHDPSIALAFGRLVEQQGLTVHVPPAQWQAGMAAVSLGDLEAARKIALHNVRLLAEFARAGCPIVATEPAAVVCLKHEYPRLLDLPEARTVAEATVDAGAFLLRLRSQGRWRSTMQPVRERLAYHTPCHTRFLYESAPWYELCSWIPEVASTKIEAGCSGMAGTFGLTRQNFAQSLRLGDRLGQELRQSPGGWAVAECSSCRWQMEQLAPHPAIHPVKVLAWSTGALEPPRSPSRRRSRLLLD